MSDEAMERALLEAILEAPDDDARRLVYADFLSQRDDPRGALIVMQCDPRRDHERETAFVRANLDSLLGPLTRIVDRESALFSRGFLDAVRIPLGTPSIDPIARDDLRWWTLRDLALVSTAHTTLLDAPLRSLTTLRAPRGAILGRNEPLGIETLALEDAIADESGPILDGALTPRLRRFVVPLADADPGAHGGLLSSRLVARLDTLTLRLHGVRFGSARAWNEALGASGGGNVRVLELAASAGSLKVIRGGALAVELAWDAVMPLAFVALAEALPALPRAIRRFSLRIVRGALSPIDHAWLREILARYRELTEIVLP